jgi:NAD(P)-dependent dehydrogenase (short-subunit alcohol dehydrogenase family)
MPLLQDRVALVTGGASGIGRGIAAAFAAEGAQLVVLDRAAEQAAVVARDLSQAQGRTVLSFACDVRSSVEVGRVFDEVAARLGGIDVLACSAGVREIADVLSISQSEWEETIAVDLSGTFYCCQAAARVMSRGAGGSIVNISSVNGLIGESQRPAYCAAKHGVLGLTKSLACDLAQFQIRVNALCPGLVRTPLTESYFSSAGFVNALKESIPLGGYGEPRHIGDAAVFLASDKSAYITGIALPVDGGYLADKPFASGAAGASYQRSLSGQQNRPTGRGQP